MRERERACDYTLGKLHHHLSNSNPGATTTFVVVLLVVGVGGVKSDGNSGDNSCDVYSWHSVC